MNHKHTLQGFRNQIYNKNDRNFNTFNDLKVGFDTIQIRGFLTLSQTTRALAIHGFELHYCHKQKNHYLHNDYVKIRFKFSPIKIANRFLNNCTITLEMGEFASNGNTSLATGSTLMKVFNWLRNILKIELHEWRISRIDISANLNLKYSPKAIQAFLSTPKYWKGMSLIGKAGSATLYYHTGKQLEKSQQVLCIYKKGKAIRFELRLMNLPASKCSTPFAKIFKKKLGFKNEVRSFTHSEFYRSCYTYYFEVIGQMLNSRLKDKRKKVATFQFRDKLHQQLLRAAAVTRTINSSIETTDKDGYLLGASDPLGFETVVTSELEFELVKAPTTVGKLFHQSTPITN